MDELFLRKDYRIQVLNLLSAFVRLQPPHLYLVLETPLVQHLENCLMIDTSSTVIELALMVLIMFLPHITSSLTSDHHLSRLFLIYSRVLCWDRFGGCTQELNTEQQSIGNDDGQTHNGAQIEQSWEKLDRSFDYPENAAPGLLHFFTFLYGLFPLNFMSYIRKARKYLKTMDFPGADDFDLDQDLIRSRTEPYRRVHLLHPNMFTTTLEDELNENRWLKSDPADVVTECMELCVAVSSTLDDPGPPPTTKLPDIPVPDIPGPMIPTEDIPQDGVFSLDEEPATSWRNTQSTMFSPSNNWLPDNVEFPPKSNQSTYSQSVPKSSKPTTPVLKSRDVMDSPTLPAALKDDADNKNLQPKKQRSQNLRKQGSVPQLRNNIPTSPRLENFALTLSQSQSHHSDSPTRADFQVQSIASLQREIMLLRNDLNFERYLKLQHLSHIGQLQRRHIKEVTVEAETQNLINTNRTLKAKLAKANELYAQLKKETLTSRSQSKKWESELSSKVRSYREEQKSWHSDEDNLRVDLQKAQQDCDRLRRLVVESEARELNATQKLRALELDLEDLEHLRKQNEALQEKVLDLQESSAELDATKQERDHLRDDLEMATMKLSSRDIERERSMRLYERKIAELESRLQSSQRTTQPGQLSGSVQQMLDSALAASQAKLQQMKKTHYRLLEQYTDLQVRYQELEGERQAETIRRDSYCQIADEHLPSQPPTRQNSGVGGYGSKYLRSLATNPQQDYDYYNEYNSPTSTNSPSSQLYPPRPLRLESLHQQRPIREPVSPTLDLSAAYESSLNASFHLQNASDTVASSGKSGYSVETSSSKGEKKEKIVPKSEVRVYGRGKYSPLFCFVNAVWLTMIH